MNNLGDANHDPQTVRLLDYGRFFKRFISLLSGILGVSIVCYMLGWIRCHAHLSQLGATWIIQSLSNPQIISWSVWPSLALVFGILCTMHDACSGLLTGRSGLVVRIVVAIATSIWFFMDRSEKDVSKLSQSSWLVLFMVALLIGLRLAEIVRSFADRRFKLSSGELFTLTLLFCWYGFCVHLLGTNEGKRDSTTSTSILPQVQPTTGGRLRLITYSQGQAFCAQLRHDEPPKISILTPEKINYIQNGTNVDKAKVEPISHSTDNTDPSVKEAVIER